MLSTSLVKASPNIAKTAVNENVSKLFLNRKIIEAVLRSLAYIWITR